MSKLTIDRQAATDTCQHCHKPYAVSRGSVYEGASPVAIYVAGMHGCKNEPIVALAIALAKHEKQSPLAVTLQVQPSETEFEMRVVMPDVSPWRSHTYLGCMLSREELLTSPQRELFFHIADVIVKDNPDVNVFLNS